MQARAFSAAQGWSWFVAGYGLYRRNPALLGALGAGFNLLTLLMTLVLVLAGPMIATFLVPGVWLCIPALWVGVLNGCRAVDQDIGPFRPSMLFSGFHRHPKRLISLGGLQFVGWLVVSAMFLFLGGANFLASLKSAGSTGLPVDLFSLIMGLIAATCLAIPLLMAVWFAPLLLAWNDLSLGKALFFSFIACRRNLGAFTIYGIAWFGLMLAQTLLGAVLVLLFSPTIAHLLLGAVQMFVISPVLFASVYMSYRDIFQSPVDQDDAQDA